MMTHISSDAVAIEKAPAHVTYSSDLRWDALAALVGEREMGQ